MTDVDKLTPSVTISLRLQVDPLLMNFKLASYNIRYDFKPDNITVKESLASLPDPSQEPRYLSLAGREQPWSSRRIRIAQDLLNERVDLAGKYLNT